MSKRFRKGYYDGYEGKKAQEAQDRAMLNDTKTAFANMPQEVMFKSYPRDAGIEE